MPISLIVIMNIDTRSRLDRKRSTDSPPKKKKKKMGEKKNQLGRLLVKIDLNYKTRTRTNKNVSFILHFMYTTHIFAYIVNLVNRLANGPYALPNPKRIQNFKQNLPQFRAVDRCRTPNPSLKTVTKCRKNVWIFAVELHKPPVQYGL